MPLRLIITIILLFACVSCSHGNQFTPLRSEFQERVLSLSWKSDKLSDEELQVEIDALSKEIFGSQPVILREETIRRFNRLPEFSVAQLKDYTEIYREDDILSPELKSHSIWLPIGWDPEKIAGYIKEQFLAKISISLYVRRLRLKEYIPDKTFRLVSVNYSGIVLDSLGDIFIVKVEMIDEGVFIPVSIRWMEKKKIGAKIQATPLQQ